jgi:hypothetical protein
LLCRRAALWLTIGIAGLAGCALIAVWFHGARPKSDEAAKAQDAVSAAGKEHIRATEGRPPEVYTIENTNRKDEQGNWIVNVIHEDDRKAEMKGQSCPPSGAH